MGSGLRLWVALLSAGLPAAVQADDEPARITFENVAADSGVGFVLNNSPTPGKNVIETMTGGVAVLDYNNDGRLDIYFVNGAAHPVLDKPDPSFHNRLYRNDGELRFTDVTEEAGVAGRGFAMGVATADCDNDGDTDIFVAGVNHNTLYRNNGDGTFTDATDAAGVSGAQEDGGKMWSVAAAWLDYDRDGWLDLFTVSYLMWDYDREVFCGNTEKGYRAYCHPRYYGGLPNQLYRNNRDGTFTDVSEETGIAGHVGKGMAVAMADYDVDGYPDIFVTNDTLPNFLFNNEDGKGFREAALEAGVAFNDDGRALSSMGVEFRDFDNDGLPDILVTALTNETHPLFRNLGDGLFEDITYPSQIGALTLGHGGWGCGLFDFNNDGLKDLFIANGDVQNNVELYSSRKTRQPNTIFANRGDRKFADHTGASDFGEHLGQHRGAAFGDLDGDGRVDVVVSQLEGKAEIWRNTTAAGNHWLGVRLTGSASNRDGLGARIHLTGASGREQWNHVTTSLGYGSSSDKTVYFGLGGDTSVKRIVVYWPSGKVQEVRDVAADDYLTLLEPED